MKVLIDCHFSIGYQGKHEERISIDVDDSAHDRQIEKECEAAAKEWADKFIELGFKWHIQNLTK